MKKILSTTALLSAIIILASCGEKVYRATDFGILPGTGKDVTASVNQALEKIKTECNGRKARLIFEKGEYDFFPNKGNEREYYISNHDQDNPKQVAVAIEGMKNFTLDGSGADFYMNGRMLPVSMVGCEGCNIENLHIDTRIPQITQVEILENKADSGYITYRIAPYVKYKITDNRLVVGGTNWEFTPTWGIAFDGKTKHLVYRTSDIGVGANNVEEIEPYVIRARWKEDRKSVV